MTDVHFQRLVENFQSKEEVKVSFLLVTLPSTRGSCAQSDSNIANHLDLDKECFELEEIVAIYYLYFYMTGTTPLHLFLFLFLPPSLCPLPLLLLLPLIIPLYALFSSWFSSPRLPPSHSIACLLLFLSSSPPPTPPLHSPLLLVLYFLLTPYNFPLLLLLFSSSFSPPPSHHLSLSLLTLSLPSPLPLPPGVPVKDPLCVQEPDEAQYFPQRLERHAAPHQQVWHHIQSVFLHFNWLTWSDLLNAHQVTMCEQPECGLNQTTKHWMAFLTDLKTQCSLYSK